MRLTNLPVWFYLVTAVTSAFAQTADFLPAATSAAPRAVGVSMSPASANLYSGQTQQFSATVSGSSNASVTWSITPAGTGSVSANGLYTTPARYQLSRRLQ